MRRLRAECAWKAGQTHRSLARYLLEETHETLEAIDTGDAEHLREELGDLLLQVYFHAVIAEEAGEFTLDDVAADIIAKMRRRNPHVFGDAAGRHGRGDQRGLGVDQGAPRSSAPRSPTGCRRPCPRCCTPTRCSTGWSGPAARVAPDRLDGLGERLLALVAEARARRRRPGAGAAGRRPAAALGSGA